MGEHMLLLTAEAIQAHNCKQAKTQNLKTANSKTTEILENEERINVEDYPPCKSSECFRPAYKGCPFLDRIQKTYRYTCRRYSHSTYINSTSSCKSKQNVKIYRISKSILTDEHNIFKKQNPEMVGRINKLKQLRMKTQNATESKCKEFDLSQKNLPQPFNEIQNSKSPNNGFSSRQTSSSSTLSATTKKFETEISFYQFANGNNVAEDTLKFLMYQLSDNEILHLMLDKIQSAAKSNKLISDIIRQQKQAVIRWHEGAYDNLLDDHDDWAIGYAVNFLDWFRRYEYIDYILRLNDAEELKDYTIGRDKIENKDLFQHLTVEEYTKCFWNVYEIKKAIEKVKQNLEKEKSETLNKQKYTLVDEVDHYKERVRERTVSDKVLEAQQKGNWKRDSLDCNCNRRYRVYYKTRIYIFGLSRNLGKGAAITVWDTTKKDMKK